MIFDFAGLLLLSVHLHYYSTRGRMDDKYLALITPDQLRSHMNDKDWLMHGVHFYLPNPGPGIFGISGWPYTECHLCASQSDLQ